MRAARAQDHWRHATERNRGFGLSKAIFSTTAPLDTVELMFARGITVVCGLNGAGKSTLLRLVEAALNGVDSVFGRCREGLLQPGGMTLRLNLDGKETIRTLGDGPLGGAGQAVLIDAFTSCSRVSQLAADSNFRDLVEGVEGHEWVGDELHMASYVVGRDYEVIRVFEVESASPLNEGFDEQLVPFFVVMSRRVEYNSFAMGLGELAALTALWQLIRLEPNTVVIVEEPESFLSSHSAVALLDVIAARVDKQRLYALVSTHSLDVVARVPITNVRVLTQRLDSPHVNIVTPTSQGALEQLLAAFGGQARLVLTEDDAASLVTRELLARFGGLWGEGAQVLVAGDASKVITLCQMVPQTKVLKIVGVLDGDLDVPDSSAWPVLRLPGGRAPDALLADAALARQHDFALQLGRGEGAVATALGAAEGSDAHDWFEKMGLSLGLDETAVLRAAIGCWLLDDEVTASVTAFVAQLANQLGA